MCNTFISHTLNVTVPVDDLDRFKENFQSIKTSIYAVSTVLQASFGVSLDKYIYILSRSLQKSKNPFLIQYMSKNDLLVSSERIKTLSPSYIVLEEESRMLDVYTCE